MLNKIFKFRKRILFSSAIVAAILFIFDPGLDILASYEYIKKEDIWENLHQETVHNFNDCDIFPMCDYSDILVSDSQSHINLNDDTVYGINLLRQGGEYVPPSCGHKFSTAIIVPHNKNKLDLLHQFLVHMHKFLQSQDIHYRIFVVEQMNGPENRAKLLNIGASAAIKAKFPCLVLHNLELLPTQTSNIYACTKQPRHMSSTVNKLSYLSPYTNIYGVISVTSEQFLTINGMSNKYSDCQGDNEDLLQRFKASNYKLCRFDPDISRYNIYNYIEPAKRSICTKLLQSAKERMAVDGLNSLKYIEISTINHSLFTHIMVDI